MFPKARLSLFNDTPDKPSFEHMLCHGGKDTVIRNIGQHHIVGNRTEQRL